MKKTLWIILAGFLFWIILNLVLFFTLDGYLDRRQILEVIYSYGPVVFLILIPLTTVVCWVFYSNYQNRHLERLKNRVSREILVSLDRKYIFNFFYKEVKNILEFETLSINFLDRQGDKIKITPYYSLNEKGEEINESAYYVPIAGTGFRSIFEKKMPVIYNSSLAKVKVDKDIKGIFFPMEVNEIVTGTVALFYPPERSIDKTNIPIIYDIVKDISVALRNSKMYYSMQQYNQKITNDMEFARRTQQSLLPSTLPEIPGVNFYARYIPSEGLSGDFYNIEKIDDTLYEIYVTDVSGHSISAALTTVLVKENLTDFSVKEKRHPEKVLEDLNRIMLSRLHGLEFATIIYGVLDVKSKEFVFANAGHPKPIAFSPGSREITELGTNGPLIGMLDSVRFERNTISLEEYPDFLMYTDGLVEAENRDEQLYGKDGLLESIKSMDPENSKSFVDHLIADLKKFSARDEFEDDINLIHVSTHPMKK